MRHKRKLTYKDFLRYFSKKADNSEQHAFEKQMMQDEFDSEAFDGLSLLSKDEFDEDMTYFEKQFKKQKPKLHKFIYVKYAIAACMIGALIWTSLFIHQQVSQNIAKESGLAMENTIQLDSVQKTQKTASEKQTPTLKPEVSQTTPKQNKFEEKQLIKSPAKKKSKKENTEIGRTASNHTLDIRTEKEADFDLEVVENEAVVEIKETKPILAKQKAKSEPQSFAVDKDQNTKTIRGKIVDETGLGIPGANIIHKGTSNGVVTDFDGNFVIKVPDDPEMKRLIATYMGFKEQEITALPDSNLLVILEEDSMALEEVVVVAYGVNSEKDKFTTGSAVEIKLDEEPRPYNHVKAKPKNYKNYKAFKKALVKEIQRQNLSAYKGDYKAKIKFTVTESGNIEQIQIEKVAEQELVHAIESCIYNLGEWNASSLNDIPTSSIVRFRLRFEIK